MQKIKLTLIAATMAGLLAMPGCGGASGSSAPNQSAATGDNVNTIGGNGNWSVTSVYDHLLDYPSAMAIDDSENIYVYSSGSKKILKYDGTSLSVYYDASSLQTIRAMAWYPVSSRLLFATAAGTWYTYDGSTRQTLATDSRAANVSAIAVDTGTSSWFTCSMSGGGSIHRWNAQGNAYATPVTGVNRCSSIALAANTLYYAETYDGEVNSVTINGTGQTVVASGIGIAGTTEPITVAVNGNNTPYFFTANDGLYQYQSGTTWTKIMDPVTGAGPMVWHGTLSSFVLAQGAGANLVRYTPGTAQTADLTQYVNATGIVQTDDGTVLVCDQNFGEVIQQVTSSGFSQYAATTGATCNALERAPDGTIYAGMTDGTVWKVDTTGQTAAQWADVSTTKQIIRMAWDSLNNRLLVTAGAVGDSTATLYAVPAADPANPVTVATFNATVSPAVPGVAADGAGNIYILERGANKIYKIASGETALTTWATSVLPSDAVTVPDMEYLSNESGLLVSTINDYLLFDSSANKSTFYENDSGVDNFAINETGDGDVIAIHSGEVFRFVSGN